ncbi:nuclear transport factor 2 family protein [Mucilaginibacter flavus]|uniref:nuclear transport factor 2 family protein n=1 Tax=Mucilaginibacter flavus TaxID=931504 RepID=UPI0025B48F3B|nr:nuclear transport factor 2 family protein [Mucilaginibacter flavus]MDN3579382.1 nuclear transport factor 2 family protein [Mucilaginibacter flavus]
MNYQDIIEQLYLSFNKRDIDAVLKHFHSNVAWPNGWEGGYVQGHDKVRDYWTRQWKEIDPVVTPVSITQVGDNQVKVEVKQVVQDRAGNLIADVMVIHLYTFEEALVIKMEILGL